MEIGAVGEPYDCENTWQVKLLRDVVRYVYSLLSEFLERKHSGLILELLFVLFYDLSYRHPDLSFTLSVLLSFNFNKKNCK